MFVLCENRSVIKELRVKKGKTQEKVAEEIGMNIKTYRALENGVRIGRIDSLCILAQYFDVSLDYIVLGKSCSQDNLWMKLANKDEEKRFLLLQIMESIIDIV